MIYLALLLTIDVVAQTALAGSFPETCDGQACTSPSETNYPGSWPTRSMSLLQTKKTTSSKRGVADDETFTQGPVRNASSSADAWATKTMSLLQDRPRVRRDAVVDEAEAVTQTKIETEMQPKTAVTPAALAATQTKTAHLPKKIEKKVAAMEDELGRPLRMGDAGWILLKQKFWKLWVHIQKLWTELENAEGVEWSRIHKGEVDAIPVRSSSQLGVVFVAVFGIVGVSWIMFATSSTFSGGELSPETAARFLLHRRLRLITLCLSLSACSWGMTVANKYLMTNMRLPALVIASQMIIGVISAIVIAKGRLSLESKQVKSWAIVPLVACLQLWTSMCAMKYLTLSMLMIIRNLGPILTLPLETMVMPISKRPVVTCASVSALLLVLASAATYIGGAPPSWQGCMFAGINLILAVIDCVLRRRLLTAECAEMPTTMCMLLNNLVGIMPCLLLSFLSGEMLDIDTKAAFSKETIVALLMSGFIGAGISHFALNVQREMAATSFMVLENGIHLAEVLAGVLIFKDAFTWPIQIVGLLVSYGGSLWYAKSQIHDEPKDNHLAATCYATY